MTTAMTHEALRKYAKEHDNVQVTFRHRKVGTDTWSQVATGVVVAPPGDAEPQIVVAERFNVGAGAVSAFSKKGRDDDYWKFPDPGMEYADVVSLVRWMATEMLAQALRQQEKATAPFNAKIAELANTNAGLLGELQERDVRLAKAQKELAARRAPAPAPAPADDMPAWAKQLIELQGRSQKQMTDLFVAWAPKDTPTKEAQEHTWHYLPSWQAQDAPHFELSLKMHFGISSVTSPAVLDAFAALHHWVKKADWQDPADVTAGRRLLRALRNASCDVPVDEVLALLKTEGDADISGAYSPKDAWLAARDKVADRRAKERVSREASKKKEDSTSTSGGARPRPKKCFWCGRDGHTAYTCSDRPASTPVPHQPTDDAKEYRRKNGLGGF
jgi:hypothetical protein